MMFIEICQIAEHMERNVNIVKDVNGNNIVIINDIRFKGKRSVKWDVVKEYLEDLVGEFYEISSSKDIVYIGSDLPDEYTGSKYTYSLKGTAAKAKANDDKLYLYGILEIKNQAAI